MIDLKKIQDEMKKANNPYITLIGQYLLDHVNANPDDADKLSAKDKSIKGSLEAMRKLAEKKKVGNVAVLTDEEGFTAVRNYFGLKGDPVAPVTPNAVTQSAEKEADLTINLKLGG